MKTRSIIMIVLTATALASVGQAAEGIKEDKIRVLLITGGHAFEQKAFYGMFDAIRDVTTHEATYPQVAAALKPDLADKFDVIVFYDMWAQGITPEQQKAFVALLNQGIGVVALHHTLAAHQQWPEYAKIIGGKFHLAERTVDGKTLSKSGYDHGQDIKVDIANGDHPITQGLKGFTIHDETYNNYTTSPGVTVLLTTEHPKSDRELAWTKTYANSRIVYLELGHDHLAYENPGFKTFVARSIRWAAGRPAVPEAPAKKLFNGKDLTGWKPEGKAVWQVKEGLLIGRQGPGNTPGDLFTEASFDDFELSVTYRIVWPANSGIWYRYQGGNKTFQADILEYKKPFALSGSLYRPGIPGKPFIAINTDTSIIDREGWNTIVIRAVGTRQVIFLNGTKVVDVRDDVSLEGRIGFQVHPGDQFGTMQIIVRDVTIRPL